MAESRGRLLVQRGTSLTVANGHADINKARKHNVAKDRFAHANDASMINDGISAGDASSILQRGTLSTSIRSPATAELDEVVKRCKEKVDHISRQCKAGNRKFRDIEFDLENDSRKCYFGLQPDSSKTIPANVKRVSEVFENPQFFIDGPGSSDVVQGALGDCWFLSALSALANSPGMIETICVARDEAIGVYGFIFFRDNCWVDVIIDDLLFFSLPKYEELKVEEQELYQEDKELYKRLTYGKGRSLHFARSETDGETWVPLIEKAYAKLHGDYMSLTGGLMFEWVEDLTGGVSQIVSTSDILDPDRFWKEELMQANDGKNVFGVSLPRHDTSRRGDSSLVFVQGLVDSHAYSVLRAKECKGKRFVVIRNPWGSFEWTGPWSDGSKEWTSEWYEALEELNHVFGDDGEFVMEYTDFLETWWLIQRTIILDSSWAMTSHWLQIPSKPMDCSWAYGEIIFNFSISEPSITIIALSQLDSRYFRDLEGRALFSLDFALCKRGESEPLEESHGSILCQRSVICRLQLDAGEYVVYPRVDRLLSKDMGYFEEVEKKLDYRKLSRVLSERIQSRSIASNYNIGEKSKLVSSSLNRIIEHDSAIRTLNSVGETTGKCNGNKAAPEIVNTTCNLALTDHAAVSSHDLLHRQSKGAPEITNSMGQLEQSLDSETPQKVSITGDDEDDSPAFLGLKVYTKKNASVVITGRLEPNSS